MNFSIITFGCKVNYIESQNIEEKLIGLGHFASSPVDSDVVIVNTCTVTGKADQKCLTTIQKYVKVKTLFVTGCYSEIDHKKLESISGIHRIIRQAEKKDAAEIIASEMKIVSEGDSRQIRVDSKSIKKLINRRTRTFIKIQDGCNNYCSYCRIPYARGNPSSKSLQEIQEEVGVAMKNGTKEVVLSGINIGNYEFETLGLAGCVKTLIESFPSIRFRVSSIEPPTIEKSLYFLFNPKGRVGQGGLCPHLHIPLQSGSNSVLSLMKRRYDVEHFLTSIQSLREVDSAFSISTDIIVGHPGETDRDVIDTCKVIELAMFTKVHIFPFSKRPGTFAETMQQHLSVGTIKDRILKIEKSAEISFQNYLSQSASCQQQIIIESDPKNLKKINNNKFYIFKNKKFQSIEFSEFNFTDDYQFVEGTTQYYLKFYLIFKNGESFPVKGEIFEFDLTDVNEKFIYLLSH